MIVNDRIECDLAVVGAGVSGLYTAWRVAREAKGEARNIAVFEATDRTGGRLWSIDLRDERTIPAELGGMFFSDAQTLVYDLCTRRLQLDSTAITAIPDFAYLRGKRFKIDEFSKPGAIPFNLAEDEKGLPYHELTLMALRRIVPDLDDYWPLNPDSKLSDTVAHLRTVKFDDRPLHHWGFWNLLSKVISNEAYLCLKDVVSAFSVFSNWNGRDAIFSILSDLTGNWYRLRNGYQRLPDALATDLAELDVPIHFGHRLQEVRGGEGQSTVLTFDHKGSEVSVFAEKAVLALPKSPLESLDPNSIVYTHASLSEQLASVDPVPACKIFLTFDEPWWRNVPDGPGRIAVDSFALSHTDLPMRQCYYLGVDPHTGEGLLLASYGDMQAVPYWSVLMSDSGRDRSLRCDVPKVARKEIRRQLGEMHDIDVPEPNDAVFVDWAQPPFGGGWHAWQPGWDSSTVTRNLQSPVPGRSLHICGEAYSAYQSWVEGALTSAEAMLQDRFGLEPPSWLTSSQCLAPYRQTE